MSVPVRDWTNAAVLEYRLLRWDYQLLKTHHVPLADYDRTRDQFTRLNKGSKAETKTAHTENFVEQSACCSARGWSCARRWARQ